MRRDKREAIGSRLLAPLMRRDEREAIALVSPLDPTTLVVDISTGQDSGYRSSQDCAATGASDSAQQQMAKAAIAGSFIIAGPQPMGETVQSYAAPSGTAMRHDYLAGLAAEFMLSCGGGPLPELRWGRLSICLGGLLQPSLL